MLQLAGYGLSGFPEAIEATWPKATVQTCVVHLIDAAMRFVGYQDRKKISALLLPRSKSVWISIRSSIVKCR